MNTVHEALRRVDLNLLLVFDALYRHRSVVAAAEELALSASACSHALTRLRSSLGDGLFARYGSGMQPTPLAEQIAPGVASALQLLADQLDGARPFVASRSSHSFTVLASDFTAFMLLPGLLAQWEQQAPHVRLRVLQSSHRDALDDLASGRAHCVLGFSDETSAAPAGVESLEGFRDDYVVMARPGHARIGATLSLEQYLAERHAAVLPWNDAQGVIDTALAQQGLQRDVAVQLPSMVVAPFIVAQTQYLLTLPRRAAQALARVLPLVLFPAPFRTPPYSIQVLFHARHADTPAQRWLRQQMLQVLQTPGAPGGE